MEKLELKDIAGYLPYGLKVNMYGNYNGSENVLLDTYMLQEDKTNVGLPVVALFDYRLWEKEGDDTLGNILSYQFKPILCPMFDLYKPCLEDEKIPIVELFKLLCTPEEPFESFKTRTMIDYLEIDNNSMFYLQEGAFRYVVEEKIEGFIPCQIELFEKLYEWHFDIKRLIEKGLAIDINTTTN